MKPFASLLPKPARLEPGEGSVRLSGATRVHLSSDVKRAQEVARELEQSLADRFESVSSGSGAKASIHLAVVVPASDHLDREWYLLSVIPEKVSIEARAPAGLFYGVVTLLQLLDEFPDGEIPCVRIEDSPRFPWRGAHLDVCRHFFPVSFVKRFIDLLALHKLNRFHWHLTEDQGWRVEIERYPRLVEVGAWRTVDGQRTGGFYTSDEIREVVEYAARRFVTIVPEIEMPGHALAALAAYPELACTAGPFEVTTEWGIFDDVFCAGNDHTLEFLETVLDEVMGLFPGELIHIGGDECPKARWRDCPRCQSRIQNEGLADEDALQGWFTARISRFLDDRGRKAIGWDEVLEGGVDRSVAVMCWRGSDKGVEAVRQGREVVMCPITHCYFDYAQSDDPAEPGNIGVTSLETAYQFEPRPELLTDVEGARILGGQGNLWTEKMATEERLEYMAFPRLCALAEVVWSPPGGRSWPEFRGRLARHLRRLEEQGVHYRPLGE